MNTAMNLPFFAISAMIFGIFRTHQTSGTVFSMYFPLVPFLLTHYIGMSSATPVTTPESIATDKIISTIAATTVTPTIKKTARIPTMATTSAYLTDRTGIINRNNSSENVTKPTEDYNNKEGEIFNTGYERIQNKYSRNYPKSDPRGLTSFVGRNEVRSVPGKNDIITKDNLKPVFYEMDTTKLTKMYLPKRQLKREKTEVIRKEQAPTASDTNLHTSKSDSSINKNEIGMQEREIVTNKGRLRNKSSRDKMGIEGGSGLRRGGVRHEFEQSKTAAPTSGHISLDLFLSAHGVTLHVNGDQVYRSVNKTVQWGNHNKRYHAGLHLAALHQTTGQVLTAAAFTTWQVTGDTAFIHALHHIQDGRLIIILGVPDFTTHLGVNATAALMMLGAQYAQTLAYRDIWCLVVRKGSRVVAETVITYLPGQRTPLTDLDVSPLILHLAVPSVPEPWCSWYGRADLQERSKFCRRYDGYGDFCRCGQLPWSPPPPLPSRLKQEVIPVALVTGGRLPQVLRQVNQLRSGSVGATTPLTIFVDGDSDEAAALANLLQVNVTFNTKNPAPRGADSRITCHIKFVLTNVFRLYPGTDKAIILEDDLELSPDFLSYFHQTAKLLTSDPRLLCVNAYNYNAYPHTAVDPTRLYRVNGLPAYGWMVQRKVAQEMLDNWPRLDQEADWDLWIRARVLKGREILIPEVPRTKHVGGGGVHVTGLEQAVHHGRRSLNNLPNVTLDISGAEFGRYLKTHLSNIRSGHVVRLSDHPCKVLPLPTTQVNQSFVVYLYQPDETNNSSWAYYVVARCLGLNDHNYHENLKMMFTSSFYGNQLYVIGCPTSPFCLTSDERDVYRASKEDVQFADNHPFRRIVIKRHVALRVPATSVSELVSLENLVDYTISQV